jgi:hypothetical protein
MAVDSVCTDCDIAGIVTLLGILSAVLGRRM